MKAIITGSEGQLGRALLSTLPEDGRVVSLGRKELDITDESAVHDRILAERPDAIINAAAYTAVDQAESEPDLAMSVNAHSVGHLARAASKIGCRLIQVSTDFVFDGKNPVPYRAADVPTPLSVYGQSKLAGERLALEILGPGAVVVRTAWLYGSKGRNFVNTMLELMNDRDEVAVVDDQVGTPTWTRSLATALWAIVRLKEISGIHHWTDLGVASWYDFAMAIKEEAQAVGRLKRSPKVSPISTEDYPTAAERPKFSVLSTKVTRDRIGVPSEHWRVNLRRMLSGEQDG